MSLRTLDEYNPKLGGKRGAAAARMGLKIAIVAHSHNWGLGQMHIARG